MCWLSARTRRASQVGLCDGLMVYAIHGKDLQLWDHSWTSASGLSEEQLQSVKGVLTQGGGPAAQLLQASLALSLAP